MIRGGILSSRTRPARRSAAAVRAAWAGAAVAASCGLAVSLATPAMPALAAQHSGGPAAGHASAGTGQHEVTGRMSSGAPWARIAAGGDHTCGVRAGGTLWCWGDNTYGQLGLGSHVSQDLPRQVISPARGGWARVIADFEDTCAIRTDATLWCWGDNGFGVLGTGNSTSQDRPTQVTTPAPGGWASITTSGDHTCATRTDATLWCWGANDDGQLGLGNHTFPDRPTQVTTPAAGGWASVTAGTNHTCATRIGATLWCWGENDHGQLGYVSPDAPDLAQQVTTPARGGWASVTAGSDDTCASRTGATLWCWGDNSERQLGIGNHPSPDGPRQVTTPAAGGWASVTAGGVSTCGVRTGATLWCWGYNGDGQLGLGNHAPHDLPRQVTTPAAGGWVSVTADSGYTCGIRVGGSLWCWGDNSDGQLGLGNRTAQDRPRQVTGCMQPAARSRTRSRQYLLHPHPAANAS
jgi:alpha-tubulin suppressor-like RCC1 family protein